MGSRARLLATMADKDLTPFDKVNAWFKLAGMEDYGVHNAPTPHPNSSLQKPQGHDSMLPKIMTLESATYEYEAIL